MAPFGRAGRAARVLEQREVVERRAAGARVGSGRRRRPARSQAHVPRRRGAVMRRARLARTFGTGSRSASRLRQRQRLRSGRPRRCGRRATSAGKSRTAVDDLVPHDRDRARRGPRTGAAARGRCRAGCARRRRRRGAAPRRTRRRAAGSSAGPAPPGRPACTPSLRSALGRPGDLVAQLGVAGRRRRRTRGRCDHRSASTEVSSRSTSVSVTSSMSAGTPLA